MEKYYQSIGELYHFGDNYREFYMLYDDQVEYDKEDLTPEESQQRLQEYLKWDKYAVELTKEQYYEKVAIFKEIQEAYKAYVEKHTILFKKLYPND